MKITKLIQLSILALAANSLIACLPKGAVNNTDGQARGLDVNLYPINKLVCDPFEGGHDPGLSGGLKANLYYLPTGTTYDYVGDVIANGKKSDQFFFFSQLNVPTRLFSLGFPLETGGVVKNDEGEDLVEYFALQFSSILKLGPNDEEGIYELALLSDDGSILKYRDDSGKYVEIVNNDFHHPTRLGCGGYLDMKRNSEVVIQLSYFQGPRYHISLIPMWRKVSSNTAAEPLCGKTGNSYWFDFNNQTPQAPYKELLGRGWKPISASNYQIPQTVAFNPCTEGIKPVLSNFKAEVQGSKIVATWSTNFPASSQLRYRNLDSGSDDLTISDNILRTEHRVETPLLGPGPYVVQGISISDTYGKTLSPGIELFIAAF